MIRDGGSTALPTAFTVDSVAIVDTAYTRRKGGTAGKEEGEEQGEGGRREKEGQATGEGWEVMKERKREAITRRKEGTTTPCQWLQRQSQWHQQKGHSSSGHIAITSDYLLPHHIIVIIRRAGGGRQKPEFHLRKPGLWVWPRPSCSCQACPRFLFVVFRSSDSC